MVGLAISVGIANVVRASFRTLEGSALAADRAFEMQKSWEEDEENNFMVGFHWSEYKSGRFWGPWLCFQHPKEGNKRTNCWW